MKMCSLCVRPAPPPSSFSLQSYFARTSLPPRAPRRQRNVCPPTRAHVLVLRLCDSSPQAPGVSVVLLEWSCRPRVLTPLHFVDHRILACGLPLFSQPDSKGATQAFSDDTLVGQGIWGTGSWTSGDSCTFLEKLDQDWQVHYLTQPSLRLTHTMFSLAHPHASQTNPV